mmetsp:Transcript_38812/g.83615  ORF Transcript_38812/g.83615 Transcript_38812/m.83615 type:complete len:84 (+) Transcript_38812:548-799(+)
MHRWIRTARHRIQNPRLLRRFEEGGGGIQGAEVVGVLQCDTSTEGMSTHCSWTIRANESERGEGFDDVLNAGLEVVGLCVGRR